MVCMQDEEDIKCTRQNGVRLIRRRRSGGRRRERVSGREVVKLVEEARQCETMKSEDKIFMGTHDSV